MHFGQLLTDLLVKCGPFVGRHAVDREPDIPAQRQAQVSTAELRLPLRRLDLQIPARCPRVGHLILYTHVLRKLAYLLLVVLEELGHRIVRHVYGLRRVAALRRLLHVLLELVRRAALELRLLRRLFQPVPKSDILVQRGRVADHRRDSPGAADRGHKRRYKPLIRPLLHCLVEIGPEQFQLLRHI